MQKPIQNRQRLVSGTEKIARDLLELTVADIRQRTYTKMRIADVLLIGSSGLDNAHYNYALKSHFDFVVAKDELAILAIEIDGDSHKDDVVMERDRKKRAICQRFRLPLLRVDAGILNGKYMRSLFVILLQKWLGADAGIGLISGELEPDSEGDLDQSTLRMLDRCSEKTKSQLLNGGFAVLNADTLGLGPETQFGI